MAGHAHDMCSVVGGARSWCRWSRAPGSESFLTAEESSSSTIPPSRSSASTTSRRLQFGQTEVVIGSPFDLEIDGVVHHLDPRRWDALGPLVALFPGTLRWLWTSADGDADRGVPERGQGAGDSRCGDQGLVGRERLQPPWRSASGLSRRPSTGQQLGVAGCHHPPHAVLPTDGGRPHQLVHPGEVDLDAVDGVRGGGEPWPAPRSARRGTRTTPRCSPLGRRPS